MGAQLRREVWVINTKHLRRILKTLGLMAKPQVRKKRTTNSTLPYHRYPNLMAGLQMTHPEQVWENDIT
jgi:hypothetical protein